jgi:hypothetical protein
MAGDTKVREEIRPLLLRADGLRKLLPKLGHYKPSVGSYGLLE